MKKCAVPLVGLLVALTVPSLAQASQKPGTACPSTVATVPTWSTSVSRRTAERTPSGTPMTVDQNTARTTRQIDELLIWLLGRPEKLEPLYARLRELGMHDPTEAQLIVEKLTGQPAESRAWSYKERRKEMLLALLDNHADEFDSAVEELGKWVDHLRQAGIRGAIACLTYFAREEVDPILTHDLSPVVFTPEADTCENGMEMPCPIVASRLSIVAIFGAEIVFTTPEFSSAERRRFRLKAPPNSPSLSTMLVLVRPSRPSGARATGLDPSPVARITERSGRASSARSSWGSSPGSASSSTASTACPRERRIARASAGRKWWNDVNSVRKPSSCG